jgi:DNA-binding transcriptional LysR family regulator
MLETSSDNQELWRRLDWNDVRTFLAVAECGSLNAAARLLGMTQPTISRRMEEFEYRLKAKLFDRSSRGVMLTEAGLMVRDLAQSMARLGGSIVREVAGHDHSDIGRVRMSAPDGIAGFLLAPQLPRFQMANPQIQLAIDCGLWIGSMLESEPDLALEMNETCGSDLVSAPIATMHYCAFASREYLDLYGTPKTLTQLAEHRIVHHTSHREQKSRWHPKAEALSVLADPQFVCNSSAATFQATRAGAGISILPTFVVTLAPDLVMLDLEPLAHPYLFLRHRAMIEQQQRVKLVKDWLQEVFDPTDQPWFREEFVHPADFQRYLPEIPATAQPPRRGVRRVAG